MLELLSFTYKLVSYSNCSGIDGWQGFRYSVEQTISKLKYEYAI